MLLQKQTYVTVSIEVCFMLQTHCTVFFSLFSSVYIFRYSLCRSRSCELVNTWELQKKNCVCSVSCCFDRTPFKPNFSLQQHFFFSLLSWFVFFFGWGSKSPLLNSDQIFFFLTTSILWKSSQVNLNSFWCNRSIYSFCFYFYFMFWRKTQEIRFTKCCWSDVVSIKIDSTKYIIRNGCSRIYWRER